MPRPAAGYKLASGERVAGVTTILNQWGAKAQALHYWYWQQGAAGLGYGEKLQQEADLGMLVHAGIEAALHDTPPPEVPQEHKSRYENALLGFYEWRDAFQLEVTGSELPLVSEEHRFGGTIDHAVRLRGRRAICDVKSAKAVYHDHRVQLAAYGRLWNEVYPDDPAQGYHLLRVGKEDASFSHHYWPSLETEWRIFTHLLELHRLAKELK